MKVAHVGDADDIARRHPWVAKEVPRRLEGGHEHEARDPATLFPASDYAAILR